MLTAPSTDVHDDDDEHWYRILLHTVPARLAALVDDTEPTPAPPPSTVNGVSGMSDLDINNTEDLLATFRASAMPTISLAK